MQGRVIKILSALFVTAAAAYCSNSVAYLSLGDQSFLATYDEEGPRLYGLTSEAAFGNCFGLDGTLETIYIGTVDSVVAESRATGKLWSAPSDPVRSITVSPNGKQVLAASLESLNVYDTVTGALIQTVNIGSQVLQAAETLSGDIYVLAQNSLWLVNAQGSTEILRLLTGGSFAMDAGGNNLYISSGDLSYLGIVFSTVTKKVTAQIANPGTEAAGAVAIIPNNNYVLFAVPSGVYQVDTSSNAVFQFLPAPGTINSSSSGSFAATNSVFYAAGAEVLHYFRSDPLQKSRPMERRSGFRSTWKGRSWHYRIWTPS